MNPILLIVVPLLLAFISIAIKPLAKYFLLVGMAFNLILVFFIEQGTYIIGGFKPPYGISLVVDRYAFLAVVTLNILFVIIVVMALDKVKNLQSILLVGLAALNGLLLTGDLFNLFVFLEISSIVGFMIVASEKKYLAVFNYLVMATVGSSFYLLGIAILYAQYGTLNMVALNEGMTGQGLISGIPLILIFIGLGVEVKLLPLNGWVKGVLANSGSLVGPMIASAYAGTMLLVFGRLFGDVFISSEPLKLMFAIVAIATIVMGEAAAFSSKTMRTILLYSSVAQSGLAVLLFVYGLTSAAILVILANVITKMVMFVLASHIAEGGTDELSELKGLFRKNPLNGLAFSIAGLSLIGLPMFFGFPVKMNVLMALFQRGLWWVPIFILGATLVEGAYVIRMLVGLWNPGDEGQYSSQDLVTPVVYPIRQYVCMITLLASLCLVVLGFMPSQVIEDTKGASFDLGNTVTVDMITEKGDK